MESNQSKLKHSLPLLLALVVLISCLPVIPATADEIYSLDGSWQFGDFEQCISDFYFGYPFTIDGVSYDAFEWLSDDSEIWMYQGDNEFCAYDSGTWNGLFPTIVFDGQVQVTADEYEFFDRCMVHVDVSDYYTYISVGGKAYGFSSVGQSPAVTVTVMDSGLTMSDGGSSRTFTYSGSKEFAGVIDQSGTSRWIGSEFTIPSVTGADQSITLTLIENEPVVYKTTITIGDQTYAFTSSSAQPEVNLVVNEIGAVMSFGGTVYTYTYSGDETFQGLSFVSDGSSVTYPIGSSDFIHGTNTLYPIAGDVYTSTITIDDESFVFSSLTEQPAVTLKVTDIGATLSVNNDQTYVYVYSDEGTFQGLSYSETGAASLVPGESYPLAAGDHTLYAIASTSGDAEAFYTTTVVIDGGKFVFPGTAEASPDVSMTVTETGATLIYGTLTYHYPYTGSGVYLGLTLPGSSDIIYPIGTTATLSGADGADVLFTLVPASASQTYTKVTQNLADWTGTYLIVYEISETEGYVFTGVDEKLNSVLTQLTDGNIVTSASTLAFCPVRIEPYGSGYSAQLLSGTNVGKYVYASPSGYNDILFSDEPQQLTITHDGTNAYILDGEAPFQFNKSSSYLWFRFFGSKPGGQSEIALYKLDDGSSSGEFVLSAGQWEANKSLASATNEYVALGDWPVGLNPVALSFISNGQSYSSISYRNTIEFGYSLFFDDTRVYGYDTLAAISDPGWQSDAYALIYFADDQIVSSEFHAWFTSNFRRVGDDLVSPTFSTTINIYDSNGLVLQQSYRFSGAVAPKVTLTVTDTGCKLSFDGLTYTWVSLSDAFYGFNLSAHSSVAFYKPGQIYVLPGENYADLIFNLYIVDEEPLADNAQGVFSGFVSFLIAPIQAFFTIEFIPGLSFGKIALFAFVVGLLFWFLKISK